MARSYVNVRVNAEGFFKQLDAGEKMTSLAIQEIQMEAAKAGQDKMKELIETRGVGRMWVTPWKGRKSGAYKQISSPGRIDSGDMLNDVSIRFQGSRATASSAFGWIRRKEIYYLAQENGMKASRRAGARPGMDVPGMFALRDSRLYVVNQVMPRLIRKYAKRIVRGK